MSCYTLFKGKFYGNGKPIEFFLPGTIVIIPVLVTNLITKLYQSCLVAMASQTMLAGMKFSTTGTPNSHVAHFDFIAPRRALYCCY